MLVVSLILAALIGISLGLLGGGGSILTVPILTYIVGIPAKPAIAMSLIVVGVTSAVASLQHARNHNVRWGTGLFFGVSSMLGAYLGGRVAYLIPGTILLGAFGLMMLSTALAMLRGRKESKGGKPQALWLVPVEGLIVGAVTGLIGAGGGFLVVPALALLGGLPMKQAVGTSLFVIAMKSFAGAAGHLGHVEIDWLLTAGFSVAAVLGTFVGTRMVSKLPQETLRKAFAFFVLIMGFFVIGAEVVKSQLVGVLPVVVVGVVVASLMALYARRLAAQFREAQDPA